MTEQIYYGEDARKKILDGVNKVCNAVKVTLGSSGRNVIIGDRYNPRITKDGVSVAMSIELENETEAIGANIIKEAAKRTAMQAGDGTSTSSILAQEIFSNGLKLISEGTNSVELKKGVDAAVQIVVKELKEIAQPIGNDFNKIKSVATISANNDEEIGSMIADAFEKIGMGGILTIEESQTYKSYVEVAQGFHFNSGYISKAFVNQNDLSCQFDNPYILIYPETINLFTDLHPILEAVVINEKRPLVVICDNLQGEAIMGIVSNVSRNKIPVCFINCPGFGESKREILGDIAVLTGATVLDEEYGVRIESATMEHLGSCDKIKIKRDETIIFGGKGDADARLDRINMAKEQAKLAENSYEENMHKERVAKMSNGIGVFYVGATTQAEMKEKKDRVEDAILATKSAIEEGIVAGGGTVYYYVFKKLLEETTADGTDFGRGFDLCLSSLKSPINQLYFNCGIDSDELLGILDTMPDGYGYNTKTEKFENLIEAGVIDPVKVLRVALENAASVAGILLTTEALILNVVNKK